MRAVATPCFCVPEEELTVPCPACLTPRLVAVPFRISGKSGRSCPAHKDTGVPTLTRLADWHHKDERGYTVCRNCSTVIDETSFLDDPPPREAKGSQYQNHYSRLSRERFGTDPSLVRALPSGERRALSRVSGILYDTDALLSAIPVKGDLKDEVTRAVEAYYSTGERRGSGRYEAHVTAIVESVLGARAVWVDHEALWSHFRISPDGRPPFTNISPSTRQRVSSRVAKWFSTYWRTSE